MKKLKIAQVAPLFESVPPKYYGGTERIVSYLTEELVRMGHDVTLYASGDSETKARLVSVCHRALRLDKSSVDPVADHIYLSEKVFQDAGNFDIIHSHIDYIAYSLLRRIRKPHLTTLHGRLDIPNLASIYQEFCDIPVVSISDYQRLPFHEANWQGTVYHGLPQDLYDYGDGAGEYLAFLGRISPEKRVDIAIEIARCTGMRIKIAAKLDNVDKEYFEQVIKPLMRNDHVDFLGEIGDAEKNDFLGHATALLFPVDWPEPFGLVMIEALACGTPIIARAEGSVPEVVQEGITGYVIKNIKDGCEAVRRIGRISRKRCRKAFEEKFTSRIMAQNYLKVYSELIGKGRKTQGKFHEDERYNPGQRRVLHQR